MAPARSEQTWLGNLRGFITLLVVLHHAVIAYTPFAPPPAPSLAAAPWWRAFPVFDSSRADVFGTVIAFNDTYFMALMFFISGLFVWRSLDRKGAAGFLRDRALRLGVPLALSILVLAPLAYVPSWLQTGGGWHPIAFARQWIALDNTPAGPAWFLWVLLAFDLVVAGVHALAAGRGAGRSWAPKHMVAGFALLVAASFAAYIPMVGAFGELAWDGVGPLVVQTSRIFHYAVYFGFGVLAGASLESSFVARFAERKRAWIGWVALAAAAFYLVLDRGGAAMAGGSLLQARAAFVLSCAASSFALLALFGRFARRDSPLWASLRASAYGIYLVHYAIVSWLAYALSDVALPALVKGPAVTLGAIALSWSLVAGARAIRTSTTASPRAYAPPGPSGSPATPS